MCSFMRENNHLKAILIMKSDLQAWWSGNSFVKKKKIFYPFLREILKYQMQQITRLNPKITLLTSSRTPSIKTLPTITLLLYGTLPKSALLLCSGCARGMKNPKFDKLALSSNEYNWSYESE